MSNQMCIFCKIAQKRVKPGRRSNPLELLFENELVVAFPDVAPVSARHFLVVPKLHLNDCRDLTLDLLDEMERVADLLSKGHSDAKRFFGRPPFFISVKHVHMHVLVPPFTIPWWNIPKGIIYAPWCHITAQEMRDRLLSEERDGKE